MRFWRRQLSAVARGWTSSSLPNRHGSHVPKSRGRAASSSTVLIPFESRLWKSRLGRDGGIRLASSLPLNASTDTIYALSTAPGRAAIAIVRISGSAALRIYHGLCPDKAVPKSRQASLRSLYRPSSSLEPAEKQLLDANALVIHFPAPYTSTGEDVLELHIHGGPATVKAVLAAIPQTRIVEDGKRERTPSVRIRYAEPGEFTRRAFYNQRLDLTQIEALGDILSAETEQQRRLAVRGDSNRAVKRYEDWRARLLHARGELEALIDFAEDQQFDDTPAQLCASVATQVRRLVSSLRVSIENASRGELLRQGIDVALVGAPNAGKSSLLNRIVGREAAIVSGEAGTTRDVIDVSVDIEGFLCRLGDLAGLRDERGRTTVALGPTSAGPVGDVEREGMRRARARALEADVVLVMVDVRQREGNTASQIPGGLDSSSMTANIDPEISEVLKKLDLDRQKVVCVLNKVDLLDSPTAVQKVCQYLRTSFDNLFSNLGLESAMKAAKSSIPIFPISCQYIDAQDIELSRSHGVGGVPNDGLKPLISGLRQIFEDLTKPVGGDDSHFASKFGTGEGSNFGIESLGATERQRLLLQECLHHLEEFLVLVRGAADSDNVGIEEPRGEEEVGVDVVLAAESLRAAADCLGRITGRVGGGVADVEEVLGVVFER